MPVLTKEQQQEFLSLKTYFIPNVNILDQKTIKHIDEVLTYFVSKSEEQKKGEFGDITDEISDLKDKCALQKESVRKGQPLIMRVLPTKLTNPQDSPAVSVLGSVTVRSAAHKAYKEMDQGLKVVKSGATKGMLAVGAGAGAVRDAINLAIDNIKTAIANANLDLAKQAIDKAIRDANKFIEQAGQAIDELLKNEFISEETKAQIKAAWEQSIKAAKDAITTAEGLAAKAASAIGDAATATAEKTAAAAKGASDAAMKAAEAVGTAVSTAVDNTEKFITETLPAKFDEIQKAVDAKVKEFGEGIDILHQRIKDNITAYKGILRESFQHNWEQVQKSWVDLQGILKQQLIAARTRLKKFLDDPFISEATRQAIKKQLDAIERQLEHISQLAVDAYQGNLAKLEQMVDQIETDINKLTANVKGVIEVVKTECNDKVAKFTAKCNEAVGNIKLLADKTTKSIKAAFKYADAAVGSIGKGIVALGKAAGVAVIKAVQTGVLSIIKAINGAIEHIRKSPSIVTKIQKVGLAAVGGLVEVGNQFRSKIDKIVGEAREEDKDQIFLNGKFRPQNFAKLFNKLDPSIPLNGFDDKFPSSVFIKVKISGKDVQIPIMTIYKKDIQFPELTQETLQRCCKAAGVNVPSDYIKLSEIFGKCRSVKQTLMKASMEGLGESSAAKKLGLKMFDNNLIAPVVSILEKKGAEKAEKVKLKSKMFILDKFTSGRVASEHLQLFDAITAANKDFVDHRDEARLTAKKMQDRVLKERLLKENQPPMPEVERQRQLQPVRWYTEKLNKKKEKELKEKKLQEERRNKRLSDKM